MSNSVDVTTTRLITQVIGAALKALKDMLQEAEHMSQIAQEKKVLNSLNEKLKTENACLIEIDKDENHKKLTEALNANNISFAYFSDEGPKMQLVVAESDYEAVKNFIDAYLNNEEMSKIPEIANPAQEEPKLIFSLPEASVSAFERKADIYNISSERIGLKDGKIQIATDNTKEAKNLAYYSCHVSQGIEGRLREIEIKNNNEVKVAINNAIENQAKQFFVDANNPSSFIEATDHSYKIFENNKLSEAYSLPDNKEEAKQMIYDLTKNFEFGKCIAMTPEQFSNKDAIVSEKQKEFELSPSDKQQMKNEEEFRKLFEYNENTFNKPIAPETFNSPDFSFKNTFGEICSLDTECAKSAEYLDNLSADDKKQLSEYCKNLQESEISLDADLDVRVVAINETNIEDIITNTEITTGQENAYEENSRFSSETEDISY